MTICIDNVCSSIINHGADVLSQYMDNLYDVEELYTTISKYFNYNFSIEIPEYIITNTYEENLESINKGRRIKKSLSKIYMRKLCFRQAVYNAAKVTDNEDYYVEMKKHGEFEPQEYSWIPEFFIE
jgi:hypothetical protein